MKRHWSVRMVAALLAAQASCCVTVPAQIRIAAKSEVTVILDAPKRTYEITVARLPWKFRGEIVGNVTGAKKVRGRDRLGSYSAISFTSTDGIRYFRTIRIYDNHPAIVFQQTSGEPLRRAPNPFPVLTVHPARCSMLTFSEREFGAPPLFRAFNEPPDSSHGLHSGPLLLYDSTGSACIFSPASNFMVASIEENGSTIRSGLTGSLQSVPRGFSESTCLVVERGVNRVWETWGQLLTTLHGKKRPANDSDIGLKYLSYWTDNGATYYYRYDTTKGYAGTLLAVKQHFNDVHVPIRSMQLDSWWYPKGRDNPDGTVDSSLKRIHDLPAGSWNRFGGVLEYSPSPELFPSGLRKFRDSLKLPLITHNRWISRESPYRAKYKISGIGAVDRRWWTSTMKSIKSWGVVTYEQDWLDRIYRFSPEFSASTTAGEEFMDNMASASKKAGLTMQYCMALPRHYLQGGSNYGNLTTIRTSGDRFGRDKWKEFLYASRMASALGIWPWADVFMSKETPNILLATLSAGMVGIGDAIGEEDTLNISRAVRSDGVIVKPDVPIVPIDVSYIDDANRKGIRVATTYSDYGKKRRTLYVFAYADSEKSGGATVTGADLGVDSNMFLYDYFEKSGRVIGPGDSVKIQFGQQRFSYTVLAPVGNSGIALIGDPDKFVTSGKKRIESVEETRNGLDVVVLIARGEELITLTGYAPRPPLFFIDGAYLVGNSYDPVHAIFTITVRPQVNLKYQIAAGDSVGKFEVRFKLPK